MRLTSAGFSTVPVEELARRYRFLAISPRGDLSEAQNRSRYEFQFDLFVFGLSSLIAGVIAFVGLTVGYFVAQSFRGDCPIFIIALWPPNLILLHGLTPFQAMGWTQNFGSPLCTSEICNSTVAIVWVIWLVSRVIADATRPIAAAAKKVPWYFYIIVVVWIAAAALPMSTRNDLHTINIGSPLQVILLKRAAFISVAFWFFGFVQFLSAPQLRGGTLAK
jgi:hypothetical protein